MQRCDHCHGRFGLVSHRHHFKRFCSRRCLGGYKRGLAMAIDDCAKRCGLALQAWMFPRQDTKVPIALRARARDGRARNRADGRDHRVEWTVAGAFAVFAMTYIAVAAVRTPGLLQ
jgi:hypothetical protein